MYTKQTLMRFICDMIQRESSFFFDNFVSFIHRKAIKPKIPIQRLENSFTHSVPITLRRDAMISRHAPTPACMS